jgi:ATP-binding cassette subfamily C protein CydD
LIRIKDAPFFRSKQRPMTASFTAQLDAVARPWLKALSKAGGPAVRTAPLWLLADVPAAIAFAAGLALALDAVPRGLAAAAPWLVLLALAAAARGALAKYAAEAGAQAAAGVKATARYDAVASACWADRAARRRGDHRRGRRGRGAGRPCRPLLPAKTSPQAVAAAADHRRRRRGQPVCRRILLATLVPFILVMAWPARPRRPRPAAAVPGAGAAVGPVPRPGPRPARGAGLPGRGDRDTET